MTVDLAASLIIPAPSANQYNLQRACTKGEAEYNSRIVFPFTQKKGQTHDVKRNSRNHRDRSCRADRRRVRRRADCVTTAPSVGPGLQKRPGAQGYSRG